MAITKRHAGSPLHAQKLQKAEPLKGERGNRKVGVSAPIGGRYATPRAISSARHTQGPVTARLPSNTARLLGFAGPVTHELARAWQDVRPRLQVRERLSSLKKRSRQRVATSQVGAPVSGQAAPAPLGKVRALRPTPLPSETYAASMARRVVVEADSLVLPETESRVAVEAPAGVAAPVVVRLDIRLLAAVICLLVLGTVFVYSSSMYEAYQSFGDVNYYITRQAAWLIVGGCALIAGARFDYHQLRRYAMPGLGLTAVLLVAVHIPALSYAHGGATRWLYFKGFTLQPSEIGKLALTIYAATWLSIKDEEIKHSLKGLIPFGAVLAVTTLMIFKQPDLGTAAVITGAMLAMFFVSGARLRHLLAVAALGLPVAYYVAHAGGMWGDRIQAWLHPFADQQGIDFQISRSLLAFWHGGLFGVGLGNGQMKISIPAANSDSIFATIGEETGLVGALVVVALFTYFAYRGIRISILTADPYGKLLSAGITTYLVIQAMLNMLSVTNTIPFTGVPLPFISFGGSSLVVNLLAVGVLLNVSRHLEPVPEEQRELTGTHFWWGNRRPHLSVPDRGPQPRRRAGSTWQERRPLGHR